MKKLNALNLGKSLKRNEMRNIFAGKDINTNDPECTCGTKKPVLTHCSCQAFCDGSCS